MGLAVRESVSGGLDLTARRPGGVSTFSVQMVTFSVTTAPSVLKVEIVGSTPQLGGWQLRHALQLERGELSGIPPPLSPNPTPRQHLQRLAPAHPPPFHPP